MAEYANVVSRAIAVIIDHVLLLIATAIIAIPFGLSTAMFSMMANFANPLAAMSNAALWATFGVIALIVWILYFAYFESKSGQTIGKKLVNIKVTREGGEKLTLEEALLRTILRIIDGLALYLLGFIVVLVSEKKQRLGDIVAKTIVVKA
jgi:uncharacterized RDD family membrane protein YckC